METTLSWMAWTTPVAVFFIAVVCLLAGMTLWEVRSPTVERKGFLPMRTTRGDRLFIGLLAAAYVNLTWVAMTELDQWIGTAIGFALLALVMARA